jgi:DNA adenine methylase
VKPRDYQIFRYPGGKSKLAAQLKFKDLIASLDLKDGVFYEGFFGSGAVSLSVAVERADVGFSVCELDRDMSGFWQLIASGPEFEIGALAKRVRETIPTPAMHKKMRGEKSDTLADRAYRAIFFNRTNFSGILHASPIGGNDQETALWKIGCRFNAESLADRIIKLRELFRGRLTVSEISCIDWVWTLPRGAALYLDPPYYTKGPALYPEHMDAAGHEALAAALRARTNWILSYDAHPEIRRLYAFAHIQEWDFRYSIRGEKLKIEGKKYVERNGEWTEAKELIIRG